MEKYTYCYCSLKGKENETPIMDRIVLKSKGKFVGYSGHTWDIAKPIPYDDIKEQFYCTKGKNGEAIGNPSFVLDEVMNDFSNEDRLVSQGLSRAEARQMSKEFNEILKQMKKEK